MVAKSPNKGMVRTTRTPMAKLAPQVMQMRARGMTVKQIAEKLKRSERYIYEVIRFANSDGDAVVLEIPDPKKREDLEPEVAETLEFTADGFEKFFNRYSGRKLQPVHKKWVRDVLSHHRILINCPPRHAKSTIFSVWLPIWLICIDRNVQILICSQTDTMAKKFTNEIAFNLGYNAQLIKEFGRFRPELGDWPWRPNSGELMVEGRTRDTKSGDLTIQVRGSGQQILGMEANWVIADDVVSRQNTRSDEMRNSLSDWFHGDALSRLEPGGRAIVIGQRLHLYDLYGELSLEKLPGTLNDEGEAIPRWTHINYPAVLDWDKQLVLWPEKWTWLEIMEKYADLGQTKFEAMYQQNPLMEGEALARRTWVYGTDEHPGCVDHERRVGEIQTEGFSRRVRVCSLDPSPTRYAGFIVADIDWNPDNNFNCTILELRRERMQVRDMISHIERAIDQYAPQYFIFERNAAQRWLLQDQTMQGLRRRIQVLAHDTGRNKGDPQLGVESLSVDFEFGRIRFPYGDPESRQMSDLLITEALHYPQGQTDDLLMALWFIKFNWSKLIPRFAAATQTNSASWRVPPRLKNGFAWRKKNE